MDLKTIDNAYENLEDYNPTKTRKVLIVFDDMIAGKEANKKLSAIVTELFLRGRKLNIWLVFISQSNFKVPKRLNVTHYFVMKVPNKRELQQAVSNHSPDIDFKNYKDYNKPYSFLVNDTTLSSVNPLRFRKNLL